LVRGNVFLHNQTNKPQQNKNEPEDDDPLNTTNGSPSKTAVSTTFGSEMVSLKSPETEKPLGASKKVIKKVPLSEARRLIAAGAAT